MESHQAYEDHTGMAGGGNRRPSHQPGLHHLLPCAPRRLRRTEQGLVRRGKGGEQERGAGSGEQGAKTAEQEAKAQAMALFFGAIHLYGPPAEDPISRLMETELGWKQHVKVLPRADIGKLIQTVARDPLAMGIVDLSQMPAGEASVKILAIGPSLPAGGTYETLPQGYWLSQPVDLWVSAEAGQPAKDFAEFLASGECAATLQRHGLVPKVPAAGKAAVAAPAGGKKGK